MSAATFSEYAFSAKLTFDEIYTVEMLIDSVRSSFDPNYWEDWSQRTDARRLPNYEPKFLYEHVLQSERELRDITWLSLQRVGETQRPIRDLTAIQFLPKLNGLVLIDNEVSCLSPLKNCLMLERFHLKGNPVRDISALSACVNLEELSLEGVPVEDFLALQHLPKLRELTISVDQLSAFKQVNRLPALMGLGLGIGEFDSFEGFPEMPELRVIRGATVNCLSGLEKFPTLENLVNLQGNFDSLEPLSASNSLTHVNILGSKVRSLEPLKRCVALRDLIVKTDVPDIDLSPMECLPVLHAVHVICNGNEPASLGQLRSSLTPWDIEFRSSCHRYVPSLELELVDLNLFNTLCSEKRVGLKDLETNERLLSSELEWLDPQIDECFSVDFEEDVDYHIPFQWDGARSRTIILISEMAVEAFPRLALGIQKILSEIKNDWRIYLQVESTEENLDLWLYPNKIVGREEDADLILELIRPT